MRFTLVFLLMFVSLFASESRTFVDISGKTITLPEPITRIYGSAPPISFMIYVIDDAPLIGVNFPQTNQDNANGDKFLSKHFMSLPILGGWHGNNTPNLEAIIAAKPDVIITWDTPLLNEKTAKDLARINIPALKVNIDDSANYPEVFRYLGKVMNKEERANALAAMAQTYLDELKIFVASVPLNERTKVYYAEGPFDLQTECDVSFHSEPLMLAGGNLVHKCVQNSVIGMQEVSFEQVLSYAPEVIIVQSPAFYKTIFEDKKWAMLKAVQTKHVYLIPKSPFNWTDRPPSFMRIIGAHWIASKLYSTRYPYKIQEKVRAFYQLFFGVSLSDKELKTYFDL
ncbi:ABC transporter substrate-binding protein [Sulfurospirillum multivorans]|uniref:Periplasmic binding protein n=2 Tax=Sulfurospirillum multivorans TaxID=66821 RepID=A0AA86E0M4_SULMK|nr:ABC transporter substrate-binding protein [Sulfurospirillum multivorans]AHJ14125.1 periplasmic binding protein [Sulfurospirillum multivorans DSM 12446]QEH07610.1 periplasmic binding protein [Sulfurospirillum multivorans]